MTLELFKESVRAQVIQYMQHLNQLLTDDKKIEPVQKAQLVTTALSLSVYIQDDFENLLKSSSDESITD